MHLVKIDPKLNKYTCYSGRTIVADIVNDQPLEAEWIEYFRKFPQKVLGYIDSQKEPELA